MLPTWANDVITALTSILATAGFVEYVKRRGETRNAKIFLKKGTAPYANVEKLALGVAYTQLVQLCMFYIQREYITHEEYENLHENLIDPYLAAGGNGIAAHLAEQVDKLPLRECPTCDDQKGEKP